MLVRSMGALLLALLLSGCYVGYPPGWRNGWHRGEYGGRSGWYDEGGRWQGEYRGGHWER